MFFFCFPDRDLHLTERCEWRSAERLRQPQNVTLSVQHPEEPVRYRNQQIQPRESLRKTKCPSKADKLGEITSLLLTIQLYHGPSLPDLFKKGKDSDQEGSSTGAEEETSFGSEYSGGKRVRREYY